MGGERVGGERVGGAGYGGGTDEHVVEHKPAAEEGCEEPPAQQNAHRQLAVRTRDPPTERPAITRARACGRIGPLVHWYGRRCEQAAEYEAGPLALGARATPAAQAVPPELGRRSTQRSRRTGPLLSHAKRAALGSYFAARRWRIGRTTRLGQRVNGPSPGEAMLSLAGGEGRR